MKDPIWRPTTERIANSNLTAYQKFLVDNFALKFADFAQLYQWSVSDIPKFWKSIWKFADVIHSRGYDRINDGDHMWDNHWFTGAKLNYAENLLRHSADRNAIVCWNESGDKRRLTFGELRSQVAACAAGLRASGVGVGDRVAAYMPNMPESVIMMLAATSIGAIWSSCSPDFGLQGVLDRFQQIEPKILLAVDSYSYHGKLIDRSDTLLHIVEGLPTLRRAVIVNRKSPIFAADSRFVDWNDFLQPTAEPLQFAQLDFDHPIYILYSSGTTGVPKCIVHGAGGTLLQHFKEHSFHCDLKPGDVLCYFTTCGWMMWNWLVGALFNGVTIFLYDGSPAHPDLSTLWNAIDEENINVFGTSPKFLQSCESAGLSPRKSHRLDSLKAILSTGSPLPDSSFEWVYREVKSDIQLASISGGTDIVSCFMLGAPTIPVYSGEIQTRGLGMKVETFNDEGKSVIDEVGELVCTAPFPSRPVQFWNDPDGAKYKSAYFDHFPGIWRHGDFIKITESGGIIVYGRSDATLNRGGVRIGTAEIYGPVEALPEIEDSLVVERRIGSDSQVVLFVVLAEGSDLNEDLIQKIRRTIREQESPRHVPDKIVPIAEIPRTVSGKKVELAVGRILNGQPVTNREALANPNSLLQFEALAKSWE
ncbi:MAG: acetoacetate--CoA ligase [bacterium]|nr:acetoacetate--CoA ligase [bacterium]